MIYVTGDLHGEKAQIKKYIERLQAGDVLIIAGDFSLPWWSRVFNQHYDDDKLLKLLADAEFTTCFVDGNHENYDLLATYPVEEKWGGKVQNIDGVYHLMRGELYTIEGQRIFTFGGATSVDKAYRTPRISWWEQEVCTEEEQQHAIATLETCNWDVDYVITHTAPKQFASVYSEFMMGREIPCLTADFLTDIHSKITYKQWYFGHFHGNKADATLKATLLYEDIVEL